MNFVLLADDFDAHKTVAKWYFDEWVSKLPGVSVDKVERKLSKSINRETAPMLILAKVDSALVGAAELKIREMEMFPEYEHWLGGVYVEESHRGKGVGKQLTLEVIRRAKNAGIRSLYLQTECLNGGIYTECGFEIIEQVENKGRIVLVMVKNLEN